VTKLDKNNENRDQIEYKTLTLTHDTLLDWRKLTKNKTYLNKRNKIMIDLTKLDTRKKNFNLKIVSRKFKSEFNNVDRKKYT